VYSQEAFDRIMTELMEQQNGSTAPPPASEAAIRSLPKKKVDRSMLGEDGKAECSICMDSVELGNEVTLLPCNHWFHGDCVTSWLKEHDTCPHCRKPISNNDEQQRPGTSRRRSRRASSLSSPRPNPSDGSRSNPISIPESPSELRNARQQYYGRRRDTEPERPATHRHSSSQSDLRRHSSRSHHSSSGSNRGGANNGGVTGWIRDHLPFS
jgi:E3 ubiquitin-protein ligase RNF115/126